MSEALTLGALAGAADVAARLQSRGLHGESATAKAELYARAAAKLIDAGLGANAAAEAWFVPGRIEVLGKHTDYAGGRSLIVAADRGFCLVAVPRADARLRMYDVTWGESVEFDAGPELTPPVGKWANYPMTAARRLARNFPPPLRGADVAFGSDLPPASGMSSSSGLLVATALVVIGVNDLRSSDAWRANIDSTEKLAEYLGTVENGQTYGTLVGDKGVGTFGGSEDHTAILCGRADTLSQYAYCPTRFERRLPAPAGYVFAVAASGVVAEKTGQAMAKYNRASLLARAVAQAWRDATGRDDPHIAAAVASAPDAADRVRAILRGTRGGEFTSAELTARFEHFFDENERIIPAAGDALAAGDVETFGRLVDESQKGAEALLGNQVAETVFLARSARELGASAASAFGAGFGGSVWALLPEARASGLADEWSKRYKARFPDPAQRSRFFLTHAGPAAFAL